MRCGIGAIFDVAIDLRRTSPSYGRWVGARLSAENHQQLWVPVGFAHGFLTLSDLAEVQYKARGLHCLEGGCCCCPSEAKTSMHSLQRCNSIRFRHHATGSDFAGGDHGDIDVGIG